MQARLVMLAVGLMIATASCDSEDGGDAECDPLAEISHADSSVVWLQCPLGTCFDGSACVGEPQTVSWHDALEACPAGYRLPTLEELEELLECVGGWSTCDPCGLSVPCANLFRPEGEYFTDADLDRSYYSSTEIPPPDSSDRVYAAQLEQGEISMSEKSPLRPVRCVR